MENKYYFCCGSNEMHIEKKMSFFSSFMKQTNVFIK